MVRDGDRRWQPPLNERTDMQCLTNNPVRIGSISVITAALQGLMQVAEHLCFRQTLTSASHANSNWASALDVSSWICGIICTVGTALDPSDGIRGPWHIFMNCRQSVFVFCFVGAIVCPVESFTTLAASWFMSISRRFLDLIMPISNWQK